MADNGERLEQFRKMAAADPNNEVGHFSLGRELLAGGDPAGAIPSLKRVVEINPNISKAYQLLGQALHATGDTAGATDVWTHGVAVADTRGELMPRDEMVGLLKGIGAPVPQLTNVRTATAAGEGEVLCKRCGKIAKRLSRVPVPQRLRPTGSTTTPATTAGRRPSAWARRSSTSCGCRWPTPRRQKVWDQHIREFLHLEPA